MRAELLWFLCGNFHIFVTMATGVGLTQISLAQWNRQFPKTPIWCKNLIHKLSYSRQSDEIYRFLLPWQPRCVWRKFEWLHWIGRPRKPHTGAKYSGIYLKCELSYCDFRVEISTFSLPWQRGLVRHKFHLHSEIGSSRKPLFVSRILTISHTKAEL